MMPIPTVPPTPPPAAPSRPPEEWKLAPRINPRLFAVLTIVLIVLTWSANRHKLRDLPILLFEGVTETIGLRQGSEIGPAIRRILAGFFPPIVSSRTDISSISNFDRNRLPLGTYLKDEPIREYSAVDREWKIIETRTFLIDPIGSLKEDLLLMLETIEIAIWGTLLSLFLAMPLAWFAARNLTPNRYTYAVARFLCSATRALPAQISSLIYAAIFGFGVIPGIVALGVATTGFLGKFLADEMENADRGPQEALRCQGASRIKVFRYAILPQVLPNYLAYLQYTMERNVQSASAIGVMGGGGIGMKIAGRFSMFDYGHAIASMMVLFLTMLALERLTQYVRGKLIS
ncbi:MAG: ABC transporter permease subunit [Capsulimonadales bacterium]|nr:ABC transporter permease subunit [Capsulimonadales bacterium]